MTIQKAEELHARMQADGTQSHVLKNGEENGVNPIPDARIGKGL